MSSKYDANECISSQKENYIVEDLKIVFDWLKLSKKLKIYKLLQKKLNQLLKNGAETGKYEKIHHSEVKYTK